LYYFLYPTGRIYSGFTFFGSCSTFATSLSLNAPTGTLSKPRLTACKKTFWAAWPASMSV